MGLILDLLLIAILIVTVVYTKKQGFVKIIVTLVGVVLILVLGMSMSTPLADYTYTEFLEPKIINSAEGVTIDATSETVDNVWNALPKWVTKRADTMDISKEKLDEILMDNYFNDTETAFKDISERLIKPGALKFLELVFSIIIVVFLWTVLGVVSTFLNSLFKGDKLKAVNTTLSICLGILVGLTFVVIFCNLIEYIIGIFPDGIWVFNKENIAQTDAFKFIMNIV